MSLEAESLTEPEARLEANKQLEVLLSLILPYFRQCWGDKHTGLCSFCEAFEDLNSDPDICTASTYALRISPGLELPFKLNNHNILSR